MFDWPAPLAALARRKPDDPRVAERFELYAGGLELANAFGELTDAVEQRARFVAEAALRRALGRTVYPLDESCWRRLAHMPPTAGVALGFDRLVMLVLGADRHRRRARLPRRAQEVAVATSDALRPSRHLKPAVTSLDPAGSGPPA